MSHLYKCEIFTCHIVNGSIISDGEFEYLKKYNTDKLNKELLPTEIAFIIVILLITMFIILYGVYACNAQ